MLINFRNLACGGGGASCELQEVEQTYTTNGVNEIIPDEGKDGISKATITVNVPNPYLVPLEVTENGSYNPQEGEDGYSTVNVDVQPKLEEKTVEITQNGTENIVPTAGKDGLSKVIVNTNIPIPEPKLEAKNLGDITVNGAQSITPSQGYDGLSKVDFNVNVAGGASKISVKDTGIKFGKSTFTQVPEIYDFTGVTDMYNMFYRCSGLTTVPQMDTSSVTDMGGMFGDCYELTTIPLLDTSSVIMMREMFYNCSSLTTIPAIDTSKVTDMNYMFYNCYSLTTVPLLNTSSVTDMGGMFDECSSLTNLDGFEGLKVDLDLSASALITRQSMINVFTQAADVKATSQTIYINQVVMDRLTEEDKAIATDKGWNIAVA